MEHTEGKESEKYESNWTRPNLETERGEVERVIQDFFGKEPNDQNVQEIVEFLNNSPIIDLIESDWERLENTDSFHGVRIGHLEDAQKFCEQYNEDLDEENKRNFEKLVEGFESGSQMECPVIVKNHEERLHLVSGNTRLMISRALGIRPKVIIGEVS